MTVGHNFVVNGSPVDVSRICCRDLSDQSGGAWACVPKGKVAIEASVLENVQQALHDLVISNYMTSKYPNTREGRRVNREGT